MSQQLAAVPELAGHDLREGGRWTLAQRTKNSLIYLALRSALFIADLLPDSWLLAAGRGIGRFAHRCLPGAREKMRARARDALADPSDSERVIRESFSNAGENLARCLQLRRPGAALEKLSVSTEARQLFDSTLSEGRGVVFISAHLGPFEWLPAAVAELGLMPAIVVRESYDPRLTKLVDEHRLARGIEVIHRGHPGAAMRMLRVLRAGRPLGFLPDLPSRVPSAPVEFLGRRVMRPLGPQKIAARLGCPVLVGTLQPGTNGHELRLERLATADAESMTQCVMSRLELAVLACPAQWLWPSQDSVGDASG